MSAGKERTALGVARARFVEGLARKGRELSAALALVVGTPGDARAREALRRRLAALFASAQVFRVEALAQALEEHIARIDEVAESGGELSDDDVDALAHLAATLPALADGTPAGPSTASTPAPLIPRPPAVPDFGAGPPAASPKPMAAKPAAAEPAAPVPATPTAEATEPGALAPMVSVVVLDDAPTIASLRALLPHDRFEVVGSADRDRIAGLIKSEGADLVLADCAQAMADGADLIARLRADPLTDFVPLVLMHAAGAPLDPIAVREAGADDALAKPVDPDRLLALVERLTHLGERPAFALHGDLTVAELADRLAEELRRGLTEAVARGGDLHVPLGDGSEPLAATWSAIGRVRAWVAERSGGRVHFEDPVGRRGPALVTLGDDDVPAEASGANLDGVRAIVCDDDPAVTWFFSGLLREAGARVVEAEDGAQALAEARRVRPDVVLSDILMPNMDGLALCREMDRDPILSDVPVILLSWKEDYLSRMRELRSGASGYLRKEEGAGRIIAKVREVLRPRARLEERLKAGGEVRGRVEGLGMLPLLRTVAQACPNARVTVRDPWNLFELEMRGGEARDVIRTARDGSFARGARALLELLGVGAGRFTIEERDAPARATIPPSDTPGVEQAARQLAARVDAVSGMGLLRAARLHFDEDLLKTSLAASPESVRVAVMAAKEKGPRACLAAAEVAPQTLEASLVDLARRGVVLGVYGEDGEDLIDEALAKRGAPRSEPPPMDLDVPDDADVVGESVPAADADPSDRDSGSAGLSPGEGELPWLDELASNAEPPRRPDGHAPPEVPEPPFPVDDEPEEGAVEDADSVSSDLERFGDGDADGEPDLASPDSSPGEVAAPSPGALSWLILLAGLFAVGFFGFQLVERLMRRAEAPPGLSTSAQDAGSAPDAAPPARPAPRPSRPVNPPSMAARQPGDAGQVASPQLPTPSAELLARAVQFARRVPRVMDAGVRVPPGQGLLVVSAPADGSPTDLLVDGRRIGRLPRQLPVPPGRHELTFRGGAGTHYRVITARAGETRVVSAP